MTQQRDIDRLLDHWFSDGPDQAPDRVIDVVADRIGRGRQRPAWRIRLSHAQMDSNIRLAVPAAGIALAIAGIALFGRLTDPNAAGPMVTPSPTPSASSSQTSLDTNNSFGLSFQNPGNWVTSIDGRDWVLLSPHGIGSFDGVAVFREPVISTQDAACTDKPKSGIGHGVVDFVDYLTQHPGLISSAPSAVTIGTLTGTSIDIHVAPTWTQTCPDTNGHTVMYLTQDLAEPEYSWGTDATEYQRMAFLDGGPEGVIIVGINVPGGGLGLESIGFEKRVLEAQPILDSLRFPTTDGSASTSPSATP